MKYTIEAWLKADDVLERHACIQGATGSGKSVILGNIAHSLIAGSAKRRSCSMVVIEPHSQLSRQLMADRSLDDSRLIYISSTIQKESGVAGITAHFNPCQLPKDADESFKSALAAQLASALAEMIDTSQYGMTINMEMLLRPCLLVTLSSESPSLITLRQCLTDGQNEHLLRIGYSYPHPQIQDFFRNHYPRIANETKLAVINKINWLLNDIDFYNIVSDDGIDIEEAINSGKVIIVNAPRSNPFVSMALGRLMIAYIFAIILRRSSNDKNLLPCYLLIDEAMQYLGSSQSSLLHMLHEARKFKLRVILALQQQRGLSTAIKTAISTNTYLKLVGMTGDAESRSYMSKEIGVSTTDLAALEPLMFYVSKPDGKTKPFRIKLRFLNKHLFLNEAEIKQRLLYQIRYSGVYKQIPPPPPPSPPPVKPETKTKKPPKNDNNGLTQPPAFTS